MNSQNNLRLIRLYQSFSRAASLVVAGIGILALIGWAFNLSNLSNVATGLATMKANTAVAFLLCGIALWLANKENPGRAARRLMQVCAALAALIGLLTLAEITFGWNLGIDQIIFKDLRTPLDQFPGRMSFASAFNFSLLGIALLFLDSRPGRAYPPAQPPAIVAGSIAALALIGYLLGGESLYMVGIFSSLALNSALNFLLLALGILCARPQRGFVGLMASNSYGGRVLRRALPFTVGVPILLGWLRLLGQEGGFYDTRFGIALLVSAMSILLSLTVWLTSAWLHRMDLERKQAETELRQSEQRFRALVEYGSDEISILAGDGSLLYESPSANPVLSYEFNWFLGKNLFQLVHPDDLAFVQNEFTELLKNASQRRRGEFRLRHRYGSWRWVEAVGANLLAEPGVGGVVINYHDITERKQMEDALKESESQLARAQAIAHVGSYEIYSDGRRNRSIWSAELYRILGLEPGNQPDNPEEYIQSVVHPDDKERVQEQTAKIWSAGEPNQLEYRILRPNGTTAYVNSIGEPILGADGNVVSVVGALQDVTESKKAEEALRESEEQFRATFEQAAVGIAHVGFDGSWLRVNQKLCDIVGYTREELLAKTLQDITHPNDLDADLEFVRQVLADEIKTYSMEKRYFRKDGSIAWINFTVSLVRDAVGKPKYFISVVEDITERKQTEENLRILSNAVQQSGDIIIIADTDGNIEYVNPSFEKITGYAYQEVLGKKSNFLRSGHHHREFYQQLWDTILKGGLFHAEFVNRKKNGELYYELKTITPIKNEQGVIVHLVSTGKDITEQKRRERERESLLILATALRAASNRAEMIPIILDQIISLMNLDGAALARTEPASGETFIELARGGLEAWNRLRIPPGQGITGMVMASGETYVSNDMNSDPNNYRPDLTEGMFCVACAPLIANKQTVGALWIKSKSPLEAGEVRLLEGIANMAATAIQRATLFEETVQYASQLTDAYEKNIEGWSRALDLRDKETEGHTQRVAALTLDLARALGISETELIHIRRGALLHDIGKMGVPDGILLKPDKLTDEEWAIMRRHPVFAYELLSPIEFLRDALDIPYCHHEKWDGSGYPRGMKGEEIPLAARIFAAVDVYDALRADRPYRAGWSKEETLEHIRAQSGIHFDPRVVEAFLTLMERK